MPAAGRCAKVLVVSADALTRNSLCRVLAAEGHACRGVPSAKAALVQCTIERFDCLFIDASIGEAWPVELAHGLAATSERRPTHLVVIAVHAQEEFGDELRAGLFDALVDKPAELRSLVEAVQASMPRSG